MFRYLFKPITRDTINELKAKKKVKKLIRILEKDPRNSEDAFNALVSIGDSKSLKSLLKALSQQQNSGWFEKWGHPCIDRLHFVQLAKPLGTKGKNMLYDALGSVILHKIKTAIEDALVSLGDTRMYPDFSNKLRNGDYRSYVFRFLPEEDKNEFIPDLLAGINAIYARNINQESAPSGFITNERNSFDLFLELLKSTGNQEHLVELEKLKQNFESIQRAQEERQKQIELKSQMEKKAAEEKASRTCSVCKREFADKKQLIKVEEYAVGVMAAYSKSSFHYLCVSCAPSSKERYLEIEKRKRSMSFSTSPSYADENYLEHWKIEDDTDVGW
jgi:hypothetical protein